MNSQQKSNYVQIPIDSITLEGILAIPGNSKSFVIFAHGSGSSRHSLRNQFVANELYKENIGYLLFDLLTKTEDLNYNNRFDISLLAVRLLQVTKWIEKKYNDLNIGYFGASTGAAAALIAASNLGGKIKAVVSRGGRPDLAKHLLKKVISPTLFIVGENDVDVFQLNKSAYEHLTNATKEIVLIPGASHLFEEPGTLEKATIHASSWFKKYLAQDVHADSPST